MSDVCSPLSFDDIFPRRGCAPSTFARARLPAAVSVSPCTPADAAAAARAPPVALGEPAGDTAARSSPAPPPRLALAFDGHPLEETLMPVATTPRARVLPARPVGEHGRDSDTPPCADGAPPSATTPSGRRPRSDGFGGLSLRDALGRAPAARPPVARARRPLDAEVDAVAASARARAAGADGVGPWGDWGGGLADVLVAARAPSRATALDAAAAAAAARGEGGRGLGAGAEEDGDDGRGTQSARDAARRRAAEPSGDAFSLSQLFPPAPPARRGGGLGRLSAREPLPRALSADTRGGADEPRAGAADEAQAVASGRRSLAREAGGWAAGVSLEAALGRPAPRRTAGGLPMAGPGGQPRRLGVGLPLWLAAAPAGASAVGGADPSRAAPAPRAETARAARPVAAASAAAAAPSAPPSRTAKAMLRRVRFRAQVAGGGGGGGCGGGCALREGEGGCAAEAEECSICIDEFLDGDALLLLPCGHRFHGACIRAWLGHDRRCPNCRFDLVSGAHGG